MDAQDVAAIQFSAVQVRSFSQKDADDDDSCAGCMFANQRAAVCRAAGEQAALRRLPDCEDPAPKGRGYTYVYVRVAIDPRQLSLIAEDVDWRQL